MKKYGPAIGIGLMAVLIGIILSIQILTTSGSDQGGLVPLAKLKDYEQALKEVRAEKEEVLAELTFLQERLSAIESEAAAEDAVISGLLEDIEEYKMAAGALDVEGPGVIITVKDPVYTDEYMNSFSVIINNHELLLSLVNKLKEAGAEAISINEHRIVHTTEITLASNNININGNATAPPYYIKAIGNPSTMENALSIRGGIIETMKTNYNLTVDIETNGEIIIPRYSGVINFRYASPVEATEQ